MENKMLRAPRATVIYQRKKHRNCNLIEIGSVTLFCHVTKI